MLYLDDRLPTHPKILKAGQLIGSGGASRALHLYLLGITYARTHLTDGFIPFSFISSCGVVSKSGLCAKALANRGVGLWRKVYGGYLIHDYHHWNPKSSEIKEKRDKDRRRKAREREGRKLELSTMDNVRTGLGLARARLHESMKPVPTKSTSTDAPRRLALAREPKTPSFALSCVVMREALDQAWTVDHDTSITTAGEYFKTFCARRGLAYDGDLVRRAYDACAVAAIVRRRA